MNKFFVVFVALCLIGQSQASNLRVSFSGDLRPEHRRLSEAGQLSLDVDGRGYFQFRLRVKVTEAGADVSQGGAAAGIYDNAYSAVGQVTITDTTATTSGGETIYTKGDATGATPAVAVGDRVELVSVSGQTCEAPGTYTIKTELAADADGGAAIAIEEQLAASITAAKCALQFHPNGNAGAGAGQADGGSEAAADGDADNFSQTVYSKDGSLHINKYGYLVDDNGLLLISEGVGGDVNAKHHIHIPSRAEGILVTPSGKILAEELGGSKFTKVGQIKLVRFENPQGLNVRLKMKSNCAAANEDGFALGNWCAGGELDGKDHTYMAETEVSGAGIIGNPGDQGFGRIVQ